MMPSQQKISAARGFPCQGNRGSFHASPFPGADVAAAFPASAGSVSGTLMRQTLLTSGAPVSAGYQDHARNHPVRGHSVALAPRPRLALAHVRAGSRAAEVGNSVTRMAGLDGSPADVCEARL